MLSNKNIVSIQKIINNEEIIYSKLLSTSFKINCFELMTSNNKKYIAKFYMTKNKNFNSIRSETNNLQYLDRLNFKIFPELYSNDDDYLVISFINNNGLKPNFTNFDLLNAIVSLHSINDNKYGFDFDTQIGGLRQINKKSNNWVDFFREYRLGYIFELINSSRSMNLYTNKKIELLLKKLDNHIPNNPKPSLLHGDLWEGNILFDNNNLVGFIDPGSFFGHNELEIAYLRWFNPSFIDENFLNKYNDFIKIGKNYLSYEPIYQLYYSLLNVYLWDRRYEVDVERLLKSIK